MKKKILYIAPVKDISGYATAARGYINALHKAGADLVVRAVRYDKADAGTEYAPSELEKELLRKPLENIDVIVQHVTPNEMRLGEATKGKVNIAVVAWETSRIPQYWVNKLNQFDAVITFCETSVQAFKDSGVDVPIYKVPHTFDIPSYTLEGVEPISSASAPNFLKDRFVFYNISQFSARKGIDVLLRAYLGAFHGSPDSVILILKTYIGMADRQGEAQKLHQYVNNVKDGMRLPADGYPPVMLITKTLTAEQVKKIHKTGDCYVCSSRGEGWGLPAFEALAYGNKLVTTTWGGMGEFAKLAEPIQFVGDTIESCGTIWDRPNVYSVNYSLEPLVGQNHADPELYTSFDMVAEPSVASMMAKMRQAFDEQDDIKPTPDLMRFDYSVVGPRFMKIIEETTHE